MNRAYRVALLVFLAATCARAGANWETDFDKVKESAKAANRYMLLDFTGSDWCGWCIRLDKEVFSRKEFKRYADETLVCAYLDFPRNKNLKSSLKKQNEKLAKRYAVRGYPTIIILSPTGKEVARTGYQAGGAEAYVEHLKGFIDPHRTKHKIAEPTPVGEEKKDSLSKLSLLKRASATLPKDENREMRTWTSQAGSTLTAAVVEERGEYVVLKKEDGSSAMIRTAGLSKTDVEYVENLKKTATSK